jgi:amino acid transporter
VEDVIAPKSSKQIVAILIIIVTGYSALSVVLIFPPISFSNAFDHTESSAYGIVNALYNVIWLFIRYSNANYALAEAKNPTRILKVAAPTALVCVTILYMFANIAYFAVMPREIF